MKSRSVGFHLSASFTGTLLASSRHSVGVDSNGSADVGGRIGVEHLE